MIPLIVYPNPDSWDEFYPSDIFIALGAGEDISAAINALVNANIGANILIGENAFKSRTYKKVGEIETVADINTSLVLLGRVTMSTEG